jgi:hypothetical protein
MADEYKDPNGRTSIPGTPSDLNARLTIDPKAPAEKTTGGIPAVKKR